MARGSVLGQLVLALGGSIREVALGQIAEQRDEECANVGNDPEVDRLVQAEHLLVDVDLDHPLLSGGAPVRRLSPPIGLAEAGTQREHDVGVVAHAVGELDVGHRNGDEGSLVDHVARAPARGDWRAQQLGELAELGRRDRVQHATAGVDHRELGAPRGDRRRDAR